jgi:stress response protein YsnF
MASSEPRRLPIVEEELHLQKKQVSEGKVRVQTKVDLAEEVATANLEEQRVEITRVPIDKVVVDKVPTIRDENDVTIIPILEEVLEEVLVVEKRLILKEELHIRRRSAQVDVEMPVTLRKHRVVIEHLDVADKSVTDKESSDD